MTPRPDVSVERKSQILDAAVQVFTDKGLADARMEDIADQTGLSKGTLYLYFDSKDDLIIAILDRIFQREFDELEKMDDHISAAQAIRTFAELAAQDLSDMLRLLPIVYEFLSLAFRNHIVQAALKRYMGRFMNTFIPLIQRGIDSGEFHPVDASEAAVALGAIFEGTILLWVYDKSSVDPVHHIRTGITLLLEGLQAHP